MPRARSDRVEVPSGEPLDTDGNAIGAEPNGGADSGDRDSNGSNGDIDSGSFDGTGTDNGTDSGTGDNITGRGDNGTDPRDDNDDRIIRDEFGRPTYSPTGRLRKRRNRTASGDQGSTETKAGKKVSVKDIQEHIETNAGLIFGGHLLVAKVGGVPELELNSGEAEMLSEAITPLLIDNGLQAPRWVRDINKIIIACSYVYGPRFTEIGERLKQEKQAKADARARAGQMVVVPVGGTAVEPIFHSNANPQKGPLDIIQ